MVNYPAGDLTTTLTALADPTRQRVVEVLLGSPRRAGELADDLAVSRQALSRHLRVLRQSGLIDVSLVPADGRGRQYELRPEGFVNLRALIDQIQAYWAEQLGSFKQHAER